MLSKKKADEIVVYGMLGMVVLGLIFWGYVIAHFIIKFW